MGQMGDCGYRLRRATLRAQSIAHAARTSALAQDGAQVALPRSADAQDDLHYCVPPPETPASASKVRICVVGGDGWVWVARWLWLLCCCERGDEVWMFGSGRGRPGGRHAHAGAIAAIGLSVQHYVLNRLHTPRARLHSLRTVLRSPSRARPTPKTVYSAYCRRVFLSMLVAMILITHLLLRECQCLCGDHSWTPHFHWIRSRLTPSRMHKSTRTHKRIWHMVRITHSSHQEKTPGAAAVGTDGGAVAVGASGRKRRRVADADEDAEQLQQQQAAR